MKFSGGFIKNGPESAFDAH